MGRSIEDRQADIDRIRGEELRKANDRMVANGVVRNPTHGTIDPEAVNDMRNRNSRLDNRDAEIKAARESEGRTVDPAPGKQRSTRPNRRD